MRTHLSFQTEQPLACASTQSLSPTGSGLPESLNETLREGITGVENRPTSIAAEDGPEPQKTTQNLSKKQQSTTRKTPGPQVRNLKREQEQARALTLRFKQAQQQLQHALASFNPTQDTSSLDDKTANMAMQNPLEYKNQALRDMRKQFADERTALIAQYCEKLDKLKKQLPCVSDENSTVIKIEQARQQLQALDTPSTPEQGTPASNDEEAVQDSLSRLDKKDKLFEDTKRQLAAERHRLIANWRTQLAELIKEIQPSKSDENNRVIKIERTRQQLQGLDTPSTPE